MNVKNIKLLMLVFQINWKKENSIYLKKELIPQYLNQILNY